MRTLTTMLALLFALAAAAQAPGTDGGARLERLIPDRADKDWHCAPKTRWCLRVDEPEGESPALLMRDAGRTRAVPLPPKPVAMGFDGTSLFVWPQRIVADAGRTLYVGAITERRTMYSGGGGHASVLALYRIDADGAARRVLELPWDGGELIRACFSEADYAQRAGACHDEYRLAAELKPVPGGEAAAPVLRYRTTATAYPRTASRLSDSSATRLRKRDLVHVVDPACSFTRLYRADPATGAYAPDQPLPECSQFADP